MTRATTVLGAGLAAAILAAGGASRAATSVSNSFTGFTGNSTQGATQTAISTAGFNIATLTGAGPGEPPVDPIDPTIQFGPSGATFGNLILRDGGRNYIRTNDSDYAFASFTAAVTIVANDINEQDIYFGLGAGDPQPTYFRIADFSTQKSSVQFFGESENIGNTDPPPNLEVSRTADNVIKVSDTNFPDLDQGTHRIQISLDRFARKFTVAFDLNYNGTFAADVTTQAMDVSDLYGPTGWQYEPSRIFFGGDDGMIVKDFQVNVTNAAVKDGDFNSDGLVTPADWIIMRNNQSANLAGNTQQQAFFKGDLNGDLKNNYSDFVVFRELYDYTNGVGSFVAMVSSLPEPGSATLLVSGALVLVARRRRKAFGESVQPLPR